MNSISVYQGRVRKARVEDLTGRRFGLLTVIARATSLPGRGACWRCVCDCGAEHLQLGTHLRSRIKTTHRGCKRKAA